MNLNKAITDDFDKSNEEPFIVIYSSHLTNIKWYADGYLEIGNFICDKLVQTKITPFNDIFSFPLLFIFVHSLELQLKIYLKILIHHYHQKTCNTLKSPPANPEKLINRNHNLYSLAQAISNMITDSALHGNSEFSEILDLTSDIQDRGLSVESLRYDKLQNGENPLLKGQKWIYISELKKIFNDANYFIEASYRHQNFMFCEEKSFTESALEEVGRSIQMLNEIKEQIPLETIPSPPSEKLHIYEVKDFTNDELARSAREYHQRSIGIKKVINTYDKEKLVLLSRAIRFGIDGATGAESKDYFDKTFTSEELIDHFCRKSHVINEAISELLNHQEYIEKYLKKLS